MFTTVHYFIKTSLAGSVMMMIMGIATREAQGEKF